MDLLDFILDQTTNNVNVSNSNAVIVSEEHDVNNIAVGAAPSRGLPSEGLRQQIDSLRSNGYWDAAEYGISREAQLAKLQDAYQKAVAFERTPEGIEKAKLEAERVQSEMRQRAILRAGLDTSNGRVNVMVAGEPAWYRLGVNVASAVNRADAKRLSGQAFTVSKRPLFYTHDGATIQQPYSWVIVRDDTGAALGAVGADYKPVQIDDGYDVLDGVLGEFGAHYETAGVLHGGKKVWIQAALPSLAFQAAPGDEVRATVVFVNPHDGSGKGWVYPTNHRVVCDNTLRRSFGDRDKGFGIRHTGSIREKMDATRRALSLAVGGFRDFKQEAEALVRVRVPSVSRYVNAVLDEILPLQAVDVAKGPEGLARSRCKADVSPDDFALSVKAATREIQSRADMWEDIIARFEGDKCKVGGIGGTAWAALNAVTEYADHTDDKRKIGTAVAQASRRFESTLGGDRDGLKQVAYVQALALTK